MSYIKAGTDAQGEDVKLFYMDNGTGDTVVLIHGWPLSHEMWVVPSTLTGCAGVP